MEFNEIVTRVLGSHMILTASIGLCINVFMFHHFWKLEKTSFYMLCISKTVSNCMTLLIYLLYVGPVNAFYNPIGTLELNAYLNQALGYGLILQGPITQCLITINRLLVVWIFELYVPQYSGTITIFAISLSWVFTIWFSTLFGLPDNCRVPFAFPHVGYTQTNCNNQVTWYMLYGILGLAAFTNFMNILIAAKLFCRSRSQKRLSSEANQSRRKLSIRFYFQSCSQDWISVLDFANNIASFTYCLSQVCVTSVTMGFDVFVYGADG
ncbi:hypothetical protein GCK72_007022 [Caenorhabditis remanei]|uniref:7TM GPCR serpentine receptor class x (Srx) domain-containing protein n=1 Tax=Caenorhabditis remanei TaxID=31234 RepID=A0A6A5HKE2_CAERE|nr:hypothetical protein GCK72_007022 [Caenorhabditis remanei]KAF1767064.1 hypothetical protein GCK72_007022 [Caenorhabditis remanei]